MKKSIVLKVLALTLALILLLAAAAPAFAASLSRDQMLVNKDYTLSTDYVPSDLVYLSNSLLFILYFQ